MPKFILFDRAAKTTRTYNADDWWTGIHPTIQAERPDGSATPVSDAEPRWSYAVYQSTPVLDKALEKVKDPETLETVLTENGAEQGRIYIDKPVFG